LPISASERLPQEAVRSPRLFAEASLSVQHPVPLLLTGSSLEARGSISRAFPAPSVGTPTRWSLRSEDGWVAAEETGEPYLAVWPHRRFSETNAVEDWAGAEAHAIDVDDFTLAWTRKLEDDGMKVAVFPTPDTEGTSVSPARLRRDLEREL
jgi:Protein of unknown function (DUF2750)